MAKGSRLTQEDKGRPRCPIAKTSEGKWVVQDHAIAEELISRRDATRQWGFGAENLERLPIFFRLPVLFMEGKEHREMRAKTARFFSPRKTRESHLAVIESASQEALGLLKAKGKVDLSALSLRVATRVAASIVGLTDSRIEDLEARLVRIGSSKGSEGKRQGLLVWVQQQASQAMFYWCDVRPAAKARRRERRDDVISHLLDEKYRGGEIMAEALTYGTAGVITTRQFICVCAWYLWKDPELRRSFLEADDKKSDTILYEILRLEPVVSTLMRKSTAPVEVSHEEGTTRINKDEEIHFDVCEINEDPKLLGEDGHELCPARKIHGGRPSVFGFGSGHHRCPGEFVAILETRVFLKLLFGDPEIQLEGEPSIARNELVQGYEVEELYAVCPLAAQPA